VIDEIRQIRSRRIAFNDVHLTEDTDYAKELFSAMIPLRKKWGGLASTKVADDLELLMLMRKSGCRFLLIGFESSHDAALAYMQKGGSRIAMFRNVVQRLHDLEIIIQGCFIFGTDQDDKRVFRDTVDFVNELKIDIPRYALYTPYPNTVLYRRLKKENRLLHENWRYYDTQHVVIKPAKMTPAELDEGFKWAYQNTFTLKANLLRTLYSSWNLPVTLVGNLAYRLYIQRLATDADRFPGETASRETYEVLQEA